MLLRKRPDPLNLAVLGGNQFRGRTPEEMAMWNSCANCIVYYNAKIMSL